MYDNDVQIYYVASLARARITFSDVVSYFYGTFIGHSRKIQNCAV